MSTKEKDFLSNCLILIYVISLIILNFTYHSQLQPITTDSMYLSPNVLASNISSIVINVFILVNISIWLIYILTSHKLQNIDIFTIFILIIYVCCTLFHLNIIPKSLLILYCIVPNCRLINFNKISLYDFLAKLFSVISIIICYLLNLFPNNPVNMYRIGTTIEKRYSLGFNSPNVLAGTVLSLIFAFLIYYFKDQHNPNLSDIGIIILLIVVYLILNYITRSNGVDIALLVIIILISLHLFGIDKIINHLIFPSYFLMLFWLVITFNFDPSSSFFNYLNKDLDGRLNIQFEALEKYPLNLFGHVNMSSMKHIGTIDNTLVWVILSCGILGLLLFYLMLFRFSIYVKHCHKLVIPIIYISLLMYSLVEIQMISLNFIIFIIYPLILHYSQINSKNKI